MTSSTLCTLNILLADDGSEHSHAAVQLVGDLALDNQTKIMALRVFTPADSAKVWALENALEATVEKLKSQGKQVESKLILGHPAMTIIKTAEKHEDNFIVIGAKGLRATLGVFLGGVVQQVSEHAKRPILVVRAPYTGLKRVLLTVDGSTESNEMVQCVSDFPFPKGVTFDIINIAPPIPSEDEIDELQEQAKKLDPPISLPVDEMREETHQRAQKEERSSKKILKEAHKILQEKGIDAETHLVSGDEATEIIEYAKKHNTDLIVSGGQGLGPIKSWVLGSVSRKLLHYAPCSVMIVKGKK